MPQIVLPDPPQQKWSSGTFQSPVQFTADVTTHASTHNSKSDKVSVSSKGCFVLASIHKFSTDTYVAQVSNVLLDIGIYYHIFPRQNNPEIGM